MYIVVMRSLFVNVAAVRQQLNNQLSRIRGRLGTPSQKPGLRAGAMADQAAPLVWLYA